MSLEQALSEVLGSEVSDLRRLTGGASRTTWAFSSQGRRLILRTGPADEAHASMELEARAQTLAGAHGAPVPEILAASNSVDPLGNPYLICTEIPGETIVRKIFRGLDDAGRAALLTQCASALAAIHRADPAAANLSDEDQLGAWRAELDAVTEPGEPPRHSSGRFAGWNATGRPRCPPPWCTAISGWAI